MNRGLILHEEGIFFLGERRRLQCNLDNLIGDFKPFIRSTPFTSNLWQAASLASIKPASEA